MSYVLVCRYLKVKYYERSPPSSTTTFRFDEDSEMLIDAEGVVFSTPIRLQQVSLRRTSARLLKKRVSVVSSELVSLDAHTVEDIESSVINLSV